MATLATETWTGSNGSAWPAQWTTGQTATGGSATIQSNKGRLSSGTVGGYAGRVSRRLDITAPVDVDISGTWTPDANEPYGGIGIRADNSLDTQTGYYLGISKAGSLNVTRYIGYTGTNLGTFSFSASSNVTYGFRFRVVGNVIRARLWSGTEPGTWQLDTTDSGVTAAGAVGFTITCGAAAINHSIDFDDLIVTDGVDSVTITPSVIARSIVVPAPTVVVSPTPATIASTVVVPAPNVIAGGNSTASPPTIARTVSVPTPTVFLPDARPQPSTIARSVVVPAPAVQASANVTPATAARLFSVPLPNIRLVEFGPIPLYRVQTRLRNGTFIAELPYRNLQFELGWNKPYGFRFEVPLDHPLITPATLEPGLHEVWVWRNGTVVTAGPLWDVVASSDGRTISCSGMNLLDYYDVRLINNVEYNVLDQTTIAWNLINQSQLTTDGGLNIIQGTLSAGVTRSAKWIDYDNKYVLESVIDMSELDQGFDFYINPATRAFTALYPRPQRNIGLQLIYPYHIRRYSVQYMGKWMRNRVRMTGEDPNYATAVDTTSRSYYGLRDLGDSYRDAATVTDLTAYASKIRDRRSEVKKYPTCILSVQNIDIFNEGTIKYGDIVRVVIKDGYVQYDRDMRYIVAQVTVDKQGVESVVIYLQDPRELE